MRDPPPVLLFMARFWYLSFPVATPFWPDRFDQTVLPELLLESPFPPPAASTYQFPFISFRLSMIVHRLSFAHHTLCTIIHDAVCALQTSKNKRKELLVPKPAPIAQLILGRSTCGINAERTIKKPTGPKQNQAEGWVFGNVGSPLLPMAGCLPALPISSFARPMDCRMATL